MLLLFSILSLGFLRISGSPSELRLSRSGYEIISFNDDRPKDNGSLEKLENSDEVLSKDSGFLNFEKVADPLSSSDEMSRNVRQRKHENEIEKVNPGTRIRSEIRHNMIELTAKDSTNTIPKRNNVYLSIGMPRRWQHTENLKKEKLLLPTVGTVDTGTMIIFEKNDGDHSRRMIEKIADSKNMEKKYSASLKSKIKKISKDSELFGKVASMDKVDKIFNSMKKNESSSSPRITSTEISNPRSFWFLTKNPEFYSPARVSDSESLTNDARHRYLPYRSPINLSIKKKSNSPIGGKIDWDNGRNDRINQESNEFELLETWNKRLPERLTTIKNFFNRPKNTNKMSLNLIDFVPLSGTGLNIFSMASKNARSFEMQEEPLMEKKIEENHRDRQVEGSESFFDTENVESGDSFEKPITEPGNTNRGTYTIQSRDIFDGSTNDLENNPADENKEEMEESKHINGNSMILKRKCNKMKDPFPFYQFLTKFSEVILENAIKYETNIESFDTE